MIIPEYLVEYFQKLECEGIILSNAQKKWYIAKETLLKEDMFREYPSIPDEAFQASKEGYWYSLQMKELWENGHITNISVDKTQPVYTAMDLGQRDLAAVWFFQFSKSGEILVVDYFESADTRLDQLVHIFNSKGYTYGTHIWPHDARHRDRAGITFEQQARSFNLTGIVLESHGLLDGINLVRSTLSKIWFDKVRCKQGILALENYQKTWNNLLGGYTAIPLHNNYSAGADAMRYLCAGYQKINTNANLDDEMKAIRNYFG